MLLVHRSHFDWQCLQTCWPKAWSPQMRKKPSKQGRSKPKVILESPWIIVNSLKDHDYIMGRNHYFIMCYSSSSLPVTSTNHWHLVWGCCHEFLLLESKSYTISLTFSTFHIYRKKKQNPMQQHCIKPVIRMIDTKREQLRPIGRIKAVRSSSVDMIRPLSLELEEKSLKCDEAHWAGRPRETLQHLDACSLLLPCLLGALWSPASSKHHAGPRWAFLPLPRTHSASEAMPDQHRTKERRQLCGKA